MSAGGVFLILLAGATYCDGKSAGQARRNMVVCGLAAAHRLMDDLFVVGLSNRWRCKLTALWGAIPGGWFTRWHTGETRRW